MSEQPRLRVVLLSLEWPSAEHVGGVGRYAYRLATGLAERVDLTVVTTAGGLDLPGARVLRLPRMRGRLRRYYWMPLLLRRLVASLPDVDVVHAFGDDWAVGRSRALRVRTFHGSSYSEARASRGLRRLNHLVLAFLERVSARRCDVRIGVGPESADEFRCDRIMPPVTQVDPPAREPTAEATAAFIGSFHGRKRGWLAEQLVEQASAELGRPITLHVIGPADDAGNWKPRTVHHAALADDQVLQVLARSWLLLAPSAYEGFGIPTYESMACGVPVVSSPNPGSTYLAGLTNDDRVLTIAADPDLPSSTVRTITRGPLLGPAASTAAAGAVDRLLAMASADRLVDEVYRSPRSRR